MKKIQSYLQKYNFLTICISLTVIDICIAYFFLFFGELFDDGFNDLNQNNVKESLTNIFIFSIIISPLLETLIAQHLIIKGLQKIKHKLINLNTITIISSLIFSLGHFANGNIWIIVFTFFSGISLCIIYFEAMSRKLNAFWMTTIFHAFYNLFIFFIADILKIDK